MEDKVIPKLFRKFLIKKNKEYTFDNKYIKVTYRVTGVKVHNWTSLSDYLCNIKIIKAERLRNGKFIPIYTDTSERRSIGRSLRRGGWRHTDLYHDCMFFNSSPTLQIYIDKIIW